MAGPPHSSVTYLFMVTTMTLVAIANLPMVFTRGLTLGIGLGATLLLFPCFVLFIEALAAVLKPAAQNPEKVPLAEDTALAVLVPAHNETVGIRPTLESIFNDLRPQDRVVVVADNCTDNTASVARDLGATVVERCNNALQGKGYALDYGLNYLQADPPDVVIFMDADCQVEPGSLPGLAHQALAQSRPVQACYLIEQPATQSLKGAISAFAFKVKNYVRPLGLKRWGAPCLLVGTGIALPWQAAMAVNVASSNIVEDMKWGLDLAIQGHSPTFLPEANVTSRLPSEEQAAKGQRTRWEHGHLQMITSYTHRLIWQSIRQRKPGLFALALELSVLPLSLLVMLWAGITVATLGVVALGGSTWPFQIAAVAGICLFLGVFLAWGRYGRNELSLTQLAMVPVYIVWKIPLYIMYLLRPQNQWVRTQRDAAE
jgi:cellulose synthase/poly-beta-1,6-N-acetylglucosamine synthase-like glycosyltransferase